MSTMTNNGYLAKITRDPATGGYRGEVINARGLPTFEATGYRDLAPTFNEMVQRYFAETAARGEKPAVPY
jgi:predicted HicB family RNase H-like nuclease